MVGIQKKPRAYSPPVRTFPPVAILPEPDSSSAYALQAFERFPVDHRTKVYLASRRIADHDLFREVHKFIQQLVINRFLDVHP